MKGLVDFAVVQLTSLADSFKPLHAGLNSCELLGALSILVDLHVVLLEPFHSLRLRPLVSKRPLVHVRECLEVSSVPGVSASEIGSAKSVGSGQGIVSNTLSTLPLPASAGNLRGEQ